jgi:hypothetical protein
MNPIVFEAKKLRPEIIQRIQSLNDESLLVLHRVLLIVEKERLWRELSAEAEQDRVSGKFERLPEITCQARAEFARPMILCIDTKYRESRLVNDQPQ